MTEMKHLKCVAPGLYGSTIRVRGYDVHVPKGGLVEVPLEVAAVLVAGQGWKSADGSTIQPAGRQRPDLPLGSLPEGNAYLGRTAQRKEAEKAAALAAAAEADKKFVQLEAALMEERSSRKSLELRLEALMGLMEKMTAPAPEEKAAVALPKASEPEVAEPKAPEAPNKSEAKADGEKQKKKG